nr:hypothetical protein [Tanacetum cinerariifolium]
MNYEPRRMVTPVLLRGPNPLLSLAPDDRGREPLVGADSMDLPHPLKEQHESQAARVQITADSPTCPFLLTRHPLLLAILPTTHQFRRNSQSPIGREKGPEEKDFLRGYLKIKRGEGDDSMAEGKRERTRAWIFYLSEVPESMKGNLKLRLRSKGSPREVVISSCLLGESKLLDHIFQPDSERSLSNEH